MSAEDEQKYKRRSKWSLITDINDQPRGVNLININEARTILVTYMGGISTFSNQMQVSEFMLKNLNIPKHLLPAHY
ncbi:MAG TPA: hypothetical protein VK625_17230 [Flavitalea sp.]|nr:hypothetical protein [Flavitalea sp.]